VLPGERQPDGGGGEHRADDDRLPAGGPGGDGARAGAAALSAAGVDAANQEPGPSEPPHPALTGRIEFLDVLRGVAILGILPVNAWSFAYTSDVYDDPSHPVAGGVLAVVLVKWLFEQKFITLFALLFGVGIGVQRLRADAAGRSFAPPMARRLVTLLVLGVLHATLLWYGDIVFVYALMGLTLCWFAWGRRDVLAWIGALAALPTLGFLLLQVLAAIAMPDASDAWEGASREAAVYGAGTFSEIAALRARMWGRLVGFGIFVYGPRLAGLLLLGKAIAKSPTLLSPGTQEGARLHRRVVFVALPIGLVIDGLCAWTYATADAWSGRALADVLHFFGSLALAAGYASSVALLVGRAPTALWSRPLAAVGRTAFSCYIGQSIVMTTLFYSYGFALFDRVTRWELWGIVLLVWIGELTLATLWLRWFRIGPLEWFWRSLTHLRPQALLRGSP